MDTSENGAPSSRHQQLNLYPSSDQNTQLSSSHHTQSPGIINKWFLSFCSFVFTRAHATQTGFSLYHCRRRWLSCLLVSVSPGLELHVWATVSGVCHAAAQTQGFVYPTRVLCPQRSMPSPRTSFSITFYLGRKGAGLPSVTSADPYKTPSWFHSFTHARTDPLYLPTLFLSGRVCLLRSRKVSRHFIHK